MHAAHDDVLRMGRLVDDLLLLARLDAGAARPARVLDLADVVRQVAPGAAAGKRLDLDLAPAQVRGDADALGRLVRNLVENAARHAGSGVVVTVAQPDGTAELLVDDDGPGIPVADRERVFDRFARVDSPRSRAAGGSGLGLAIAREVAGAAGGGIEVLDAPGGGARLRVRLPGA